MKINRFLFAALIVNLIGNVVLLARSPAQDQSLGGQSPGMSSTASVNVARSRPIVAIRANGGAVCAERLAVSEVALTVARAEFERHLPYEQQFERGALNEAARGAFEPKINAILNPPGTKAIPYTATCRGSVCRLDATLESDEDRKRVFDLQMGRPDLPALEGLVYYGRPPGTSVPVETGPRRRIVVDFRLLDADTADSARLLDELVRSFKRSPTVTECRDRYGGEGLLRLAVSIDPDDPPPREIFIEFSGDLIATSVARCIEDGFRVVAGAMPLPERLSSARIYTRIEVSPSGRPDR
jgi:hypothetical protein